MPKYIDQETAIANIVAMTAFRTAPEINSYVEKAVYRANGWIGGLRDALVEIGDIPAADVAPVRYGRWISDSPGKRFGNTVRLDEDGCPVETCHCSECGEWLSASDEYPVKGRFCPNCGAKMDGGTEE